MLKTMRLRMKSILWVVIAIVVPSFLAFYGFSRVHRDRETVSAGEIYGKVIPMKEYRESLRWVTGLALMQYGDQFENVSKYLNLEKEAWDNLLLKREAEKRKIHISDKELKEWIEKFPPFQEKKQFSKTKYQQFLRYVMGMEPAQFEEGLRRTIAISRLSASVTDGTQLADAEILGEYKMRREEVKVRYVYICPDDFKKAVTAAEEEVNGYFSANREKFPVPEAVNVEYLLVDMKDEQEVDDEEAADELSYKLRCGELGWEGQDGIKETGFFCRTDKIKDISPSTLFIKEAFSLEAGQISSPVSGNEGYYIVKMKGRRPARMPSGVEEVKDRVREAILAEKMRALASDKAEEFCAAAKKSGIEESSARFSTGIKQTDFFSRFAAVEGIGYIPQFNDAALQLKVGDVSDVISAPAGFYVLSPEERKGIDEAKFAEEKESFSERLLERKKRMVYGEWFADLAKEAEAVRYKGEPSAD